MHRPACRPTDRQERKRPVRLVLYFLACCSCLAMMSTESALAQEEVRLLSSDSQGLTLEVLVPAFGFTELRLADGVYQSVNLDGWGADSVPGVPRLPRKGLLIQVPEAGLVQVEVLEDDHHWLDGCAISPVPRLPLTEEGGLGFSGSSPPQTTGEEFTKNQDIYAADAFYPANTVVMGTRGMVRGVPVARLLIYPWQWNPQTRKLKCSTRLLLRVTFEGQLQEASSLAADSVGTAVAADPFEGILRGSVINYRGGSGALSLGGHTSNSLAADEPAAQAITGSRVRLEVKEDGIFRVYFWDLLAAGVQPWDIDPNSFRLFNQGEELAVRVRTMIPEKFLLWDCIEFYGQAVDTYLTDTNVYWLTWGEGVGTPVETIDGQVTGAGERTTTFRDVFHGEENLAPWISVPGAPEVDFWFWKKMTAPGTHEYEIEIPSPVPAQTSALARIYLQGITTASPHPNHHSVTYLNGTEIGNDFWDGESVFIQEMLLPPGLLVSGTNTVQTGLPGDAGVVDVVFHNWTEIEYLSYLEAREGELAFSIDGEGVKQIEVEGFETPDIIIYDIENPAVPLEIVNSSVEAEEGKFRVLFDRNQSGDRTYIAAAFSAVHRFDELALYVSEDLRTAENGADYILITPREFSDAVAPLLALRASQGYRTRLASVEAIYDEFNDGLMDPVAIRRFLQYAFENWAAPAPTYVLLAGDANIDYRDYLGSGKMNRVPALLTSGAFFSLSPNDNAYVCLQGDDPIPEMFIGRIPGSDSESLLDTVEKIVRFEQNGGLAPKRVLLAADDDEVAFEQANETVASYLPDDFAVERVYLRDYVDVTKATQDVVAGIDAGVMIANYAGHGSGQTWGDEPLYHVSNVSEQSNADLLPLVVAMDCLNAYFSYNAFRSLAEEFVAPADGGAVAFFGSASLGYTWEHVLLGRALFSRVFDQGQRILGEVTIGAKVDAYNEGSTEEQLNFFTLIGDPASRLKHW